MIKRFSVIAVLFVATVSSFAGGPLYVGSLDGQPFLWDLSGGPIKYRVDSGPMATGSPGVNNTAGVARVESMFHVWENVPTTSIAFKNDGILLPVGAFAGGDVKTFGDYTEIEKRCIPQSPVGQTAIVFDADGSILAGLGLDSSVIGITSACQLSNSGRILSGTVLMNGRFQDGVDIGSNFELTAAQFDQAFTHEFGHLIGLDHAQGNVEVLDQPLDTCIDDDVRGLPIMFPILACQARASIGLPVLAPDDAAWVSKLYPNASFATSYGTLRGTIYFSDGQTGAQGVNVIARPVDDPLTPVDESRRSTYTVVSGYLFTGNPGQAVTGTNTGGSDLGSRDGHYIGYFEMAVPPGDYTLEVESVDPGFVDGSSVGPLNPPIPNPGVHEFWDASESYFDDPDASTPIHVTAGAIVTRDIILNGTPPRYDSFEDEAQLRWPSYHSIALTRGGR